MNITDLFTDEILVPKIQARLPELFYLAELESSRAGRIGMEVGSAREKILIALLIYKFGKANVNTNIPIIEAETDVELLGNPISIKTITCRQLRGVKISWTVDAEQAIRFGQDYLPSCDILLVQVNWDNNGGLFLFPQATQLEVLDQIGRQEYIKLPRLGTNPRGVEISKEALGILAQHPQSLNIPIHWHREAIEYDPYERWLELWRRE